MKRMLRWIWAPALLATAVVCLPAKQAAAQQTSFFIGGPRVSFGYSSGGYYGPPVVAGGYYGAPYWGGYRGPRGYYPRPYPHYGHRPHHHGHGPRHHHGRW